MMISDLIVNVAVIGRVQLIPGILPIKFQNPDVECLVAHAFPDKMEDPKRGIEIDTSDCTVFTVTHLGLGDEDMSLAASVQDVFERSASQLEK